MHCKEEEAAIAVSVMTRQPLFAPLNRIRCGRVPTLLCELIFPVGSQVMTSVNSHRALLHIVSSAFISHPNRG